MRLNTSLFTLAVFSVVAVREGHCCQYEPPNELIHGLEYTSERIPEMRTIVGPCRADVGRCPVGSCPTKQTDSFCPHDSYICSETETRKIKCAFGVHEYQYVKQCVCCKDNGIDIKGIVLDAATKEALEKITIYIKGSFAGYSNVDGKFKSNINSCIRSLVVRANDENNSYMDAVKVVDIAEDFRGPVEIQLLMIKKANPVKISSTIDTVLSLSNDPLNPETGNTTIEIQANSFRDRFGALYSGEVDASVTFIDPLTESEESTPGRFLTLQGNILEPLITDGMVSFNFKSDDGSSLRLSEPLKFRMREGMRVWKLNSFTGYWESAVDSIRRAKRQMSLDYILSIESDLWYNIDKIPGAPRCYFKGRIYNATSGEEIKSSNTTSFRPQITAYTYLQQRLRLYAGSTRTPNTTCYEVRCPVVSNPNNSLAGFINMTSTEVISVCGIQLPSVTYLTPRALADYNAATIQPALTDVKYAIAPNDLDIYIKFVQNSLGPFYMDRNTCESSDEKQPAFHFFKPESPSYLPVPDDTEICTARIVFRDNWNFYNYMSNSTNLPNVTGISVWEQNGADYFYTDVAQMKISKKGNDSFVFVCLNYRCSRENEFTTLYLDIDIPTYNVTYNFIQNGNVVNRTYTEREFYCYGEHAKGSTFANQEKGGEANIIEGSFTVPDNVGSGSALYDTETNNCTQETNSENFAYQFFCSSTGKGGRL